MSSFVSSFLDLTLGSNLVILYNSEMPKMLMKELTDECELKRGGSFKSNGINDNGSANDSDSTSINFSKLYSFTNKNNK